MRRRPALALSRSYRRLLKRPDLDDWRQFPSVERERRGSRQQATHDNAAGKLPHALLLNRTTGLYSIRLSMWGVTVLDVLNDPDRAALVGWIFTAAISTTLPIIGLIGWLEHRNRKDHRDLGRRVERGDRRRLHVPAGNPAARPEAFLSEDARVFETLLHRPKTTWTSIRIQTIPTTQESDDDMLDAVAASDGERTDD